MERLGVDLKRREPVGIEIDPFERVVAAELAQLFRHLRQ